ncbi:MAG: hypothetical protein HKN47_11650 [Pirellulaceae bacterium]|nr:hypothetical protein [Pirellulaceae bacterium]
MNAIFRKELRDILRWSPMGMLLLSALFWHATPRQLHNVTTIESSYVMTVGIGCCVIAVALGLLQSVLDARTDARGYLLHRPLPTSTIFWAKLLAGFVGYLACLIPPLLCTVAYLQWKGIEQLPTSGLQLIPLVFLSLIIFIFHPAAIWMVHRDARWIGTRTLPMALAATGVLAAAPILTEVSTARSALMLGVVTTLHCVVIVLAARHVFVHQSFSPPYSSPESMSRSRGIGLFVASVVVVTTLSVTAVSMRPTSGPRSAITTYRFALSTDGEPWEIAETYQYPNYTEKTTRLGRPIRTDGQSNQAFASLPPSWQEAPRQQFINTSLGGFKKFYPKPFHYVAQFNTSDVQYDYLTLYEHEGRLLAYQAGRGLTAVITPDGIFVPGQSTTGTFHNVQGIASTLSPKKNVWIHLTGAPLLIDSSGIYQLDFETRQIHQLIDRTTKRATVALPTENQNGHLFVIHDDRLIRYDIHSADPDKNLTRGDDDVVTKTNTYLLPLVSLESTKEWNLSGDRLDKLTELAQTQQGVSALAYAEFGQTPFQIFAADNSLKVDATYVPTPTDRGHLAGIEMLSVPPMVVAATFLVGYLWSMPTSPPGGILWIAIGMMVVSIVSAGLTYWLASRRRLSPRAKTLWTLLAAAAGLGAALAIIAIYGRRVCQTCDKCDSMRPIDEDLCWSCGAAWDAPEREGIELFSDNLSASTQWEESPA